MGETSSFPCSFCMGGTNDKNNKNGNNQNEEEEEDSSYQQIEEPSFRQPSLTENLSLAFSQPLSLFGENKNKNRKNDDLIYLNNAGQGRFSNKVQAAGLQALQRSPWEMSAVQEEQDVRSLFAQLIGAASSEIAIMPSTAFAITLAAHNIARLHQIKRTLQRHDHQQKKHSNSSDKEEQMEVLDVGAAKVLVLQDQYPSAIYPWQEICDRRKGHDKNNNKNLPLSGPTDHHHHSHQKNHSLTQPVVNWSIHVVPYPEDEYGTPSRTWTESILEHMSLASNHDLAVVCIPPLHWADGRIIDLRRVSGACQARNICLLVDATQAVGICAPPINVEDIQPTLLACSTHKWLRGPSGTSLVYVHPKVHDTWLPLDQHERGRWVMTDGGADYYINAATRGHFMDPNTGYYPKAFATDARRFDAGGKANPMLLPMLRAALNEVVQLNVHNAQERLKRIMQPLLQWCHDHHFVVPSQPHVYHLIGIQPPPMKIRSTTTTTTDDTSQLPVLQPHVHANRLSPKQLVQVVRHLQEEHGIVLQARCGGLRISPYLDTSPQDVQTVIDALEDVFFWFSRTCLADGGYHQHLHQNCYHQ